MWDLVVLGPTNLDNWLQRGKPGKQTQHMECDQELQERLDTLADFICSYQATYPEIFQSLNISSYRTGFWMISPSASERISPNRDRKDVEEVLMIFWRKLFWVPGASYQWNIRRLFWPRSTRRPEGQRRRGDYERQTRRANIRHPVHIGRVSSQHLFIYTIRKYIYM